MAALLLTVTGRDRQGIVEQVSRLVRDHGGNWEASRMARLGGQFAGILLVSCAAADVAALSESLAALAGDGLKVLVQDAGEVATTTPAKQYRVEVVGADRPGIVSRVSAAIRELGANVEELDTRCESAAMSGESLFRVNVWISCAESRSMSEVRAGIEAVASDLMVDVAER